jgi:hypothetical protein
MRKQEAVALLKKKRKHFLGKCGIVIKATFLGSDHPCAFYEVFCSWSSEINEIQCMGTHCAFLFLFISEHTGEIEKAE